MVVLTPAQYIASGHTGEFSDVPMDELRGYGVAYRLEQLVNEGDTPNSRRLVWYPAATGLLRDVWVTLPHVGGSVNPYDAPQPDMAISEEGLARLKYPTTASIVVFVEEPADLVAARRNLRRKGIPYRAERPRSWGDGRVQAQVLHLRNRPPGGNAASVKTSAQAFLTAAKARDPDRACRLPCRISYGCSPHSTAPAPRVLRTRFATSVSATIPPRSPSSVTLLR